MKNKIFIISLLCGSGMCLLLACNNKRKHTTPKQKQIVANIRQLDEVIADNITERLSALRDNQGELEDSLSAFRPSAIREFYKDDPAGRWSKNGVANPAVDSMLYMIQHAEDAGLLPSQYHGPALNEAWERINQDTSERKDAALWAKVDVLMTDAFMRMSSDLRFGVAPRDSITLKKDSLFTDEQLISQLQHALEEKNVADILHAQEPVHAGYLALKEAIQNFKSKYAGRTWNPLPLNYTDTAAFRELVINRLVQSGHLDTAGRQNDTLLLVKTGVKAFQKEFNIYPDGIPGKRTVAALNRSAHDWIMQAAVNLDRWRKLPDTLPERYIMVNLPGYKLEVVDSGEVKLESRVIVGTPRTRTPLLNSYMTNFMMFPYWRVPYSIVFKEMLPAIKKDIGYLASKNLEVIDKDGNAVDPYTIDWSKLGKGRFPYVLRQMDGVDNSLGIMKFNFRNKYSVYLHDTNNRGLFKNSMRAMSHGCVRVQQWDSLARYLVYTPDTANHRGDSVRIWLAREEKRQVDLPKHIPIYLRYFTAEGHDGSMVFYDDIYGEDRVLLKRMGF